MVLALFPLQSSVSAAGWWVCLSGRSDVCWWCNCRGCLCVGTQGVYNVLSGWAARRSWGWWSQKGNSDDIIRWIWWCLQQTCSEFFLPGFVRSTLEPPFNSVQGLQDDPASAWTDPTPWTHTSTWKQPHWLCAQICTQVSTATRWWGDNSRWELPTLCVHLCVSGWASVGSSNLPPRSRTINRRRLGSSCSHATGETRTEVCVPSLIQGRTLFSRVCVLICCL